MTWSCSATPGSRPTRSRRSSPRGWRPGGLAFNEAKTRTVTLDDGFDFLGFTVRRYRDKLLITPSKTAVQRLRKRLRAEIKSLRGANSAAVLARLNPIIRGWAAYYRTTVSSRVFHALDAYLWTLTYKWARHSHPNKPRRWITSRYYGRFNTTRQDRWVFGDRDSGAYLRKFAWTRIVRHQMVAGGASPDDPSLIDYWARKRQRRSAPPNRPPDDAVMPPPHPPTARLRGSSAPAQLPAHTPPRLA
jgi:RNA-directed DNA polymerase